MQPAAVARRVVHLPDIDRFSVESDGRRLGFLSYTLERRKTMLIDFVVVDPQSGTDDIRVELVTAAVVWAREHGFLILAVCPAARAMLESMPAA